MTDKKKSDIDSVQLMRRLREELSKDTAEMSFEEEKEYIRNRIKTAGGHSADVDRRENAA
jgi:hypothetical protein